MSKLTIIIWVIFILMNIKFSFKKEEEIPRKTILVHAICLLALILFNNPGFENLMTSITHPNMILDWFFQDKGVVIKWVAFSNSIVSMILSAICIFYTLGVSQRKNVARKRLLQMFPYLVLTAFSSFLAEITSHQYDFSRVFITFIVGLPLLILPYYLTYRFYSADRTIKLLFNS